MSDIFTLDLNFQGIPKTIASFMIPHSLGVILIESGPGSTLPNLEIELSKHGFTLKDVTDVLLTHIHLDHAGAAGYLAHKGANIYVHEAGAPHMINPEKLIKSATRIYGELMGPLWGEFLAVPKEKLNILSGDGALEIQNLNFEHLDTPGHAFHHLAYIFQDTCFTGDVGGVRLPGPPFLRLPTPPPEFHIESWFRSVAKLKFANFSHIAPTHFGLFEDVEWHLSILEHTLNDLETWVETNLPNILSREFLRDPFAKWELARCESAGLDDEIRHAYDVAMPLEMSADGIWRYWHKFRIGEE